MELLSPVGNFECLKAAVQNGADSIYLGSDLFNARAFANNFTGKNLEKAILYAKIRGVKTYLTLNTLIKDIYNEASSKQQKELEKDGVIFSGGLAQIDGLDKYFENKLDLPVKILKNESNIYGLGNLIENKELLKRIMELN